MQERTFKKFGSTMWISEHRQGTNKPMQQFCSQHLLKTGDLLYCKTRGTTSCCYKNESCSKNYDLVHDRMMRQSTKFRKNPKEFLSDMVKNLNYDTCHAITNNDATKCAEDCKQLRREDFAKDCGKNGGLFKCCIR